MKRAISAGALLLVLCGSATARDDFDAAAKRIESLAHAEAWRTIPWRWCLLDASREAAREGKPLFIYAIAGDPVGRC